jgi:hypothetical protein
MKYKFVSQLQKLALFKRNNIKLNKILTTHMPTIYAENIFEFQSIGFWLKL